MNNTSTGPARHLRQRLLHLRGVAMRQQSVRRHVLVRLREQARRLQTASRAGDARNRVGDDCGARRDRARTAARTPGSPRSDNNRARRRGCGSRDRRDTARPSRTRTGRRPRARGAPRRTSAAYTSGGSRKSAPRSITCVTSSSRPGRKSWLAPCGSMQNTRSSPRRSPTSSGASTVVAVRRGERREEVGEPRARVRGRGDVHDLDLGVAGEQPQRLDPRIA